MREIWKDIPGYEGLYQVSNFGKIRSRLKERKLQTNNYGYLTVVLSKDGIQVRKSVHRIVAEVFLSNPHGFSQINHIDENKQNNIVSNLEWCDASHNAKCYHQNHPGKERKGKRSNDRVLQLSLDGDVIREWENSRQVFKETGMSDWSVSQCCRGVWKTAHGYKWQYANLA